MECILLRHAQKGNANNARQSILSMIYEESWQDLALFLGTSRGALEAKHYEDYVNGKGQNFLHVACGLHPPLYLVEKLVDFCLGCECQVDRNSQTPLHIASAWGASSEVVSFLVNQFPDAATMQDTNGKAPLHLVWEGGCFDPSCKCTQNSRKIKVIKSIARAVPKSVQILDREDCSALESAIICDADYEFIRALRSVTAGAVKSMEQTTTVQTKTRRNAISRTNDTTLRAISRSACIFAARHRHLEL